MSSMPGSSMLGSIASAGGSIIDNIFGWQTQKSAAKKEYQRQKEFAQNQIQWRVKDAQAAGIHPLYALGAQGVSYAPQSAGGLDLGLGDMGQDISRAVLANRDRREQIALQQWERERAVAADRMAQERHSAEMGLIGAETELARSQAMRNAHSAQLGPGLTGGDARPGDVVRYPSEVIVGSPGAPNIQPGIITDYQFSSIDPQGRAYAIAPSADTKQRIEDMGALPWIWSIRNATFFPPRGGFARMNAEHPPAAGFRWEWIPFLGFQQMRIRGRRTQGAFPRG